MRRSGGELAQRDELFRLHDLRLQPFQILDGLFRPGEKPRAVPVSKMGTQKDQQR